MELHHPMRMITRTDHDAGGVQLSLEPFTAAEPGISRERVRHPSGCKKDDGLTHASHPYAVSAHAVRSRRCDIFQSPEFDGFCSAAGRLVCCGRHLHAQ